MDFARHVGAEALRIREAGRRLVDARVHGAAEVFQERTEQAPIEVGPARDTAEKCSCDTTAGLRVADWQGPRSGRRECAGAGDAREKSASIESTHDHIRM